MTPTVRKYAIFFLVFGIWYGLDLWTKAWADDHLADPFHPVAVRVGAEDAGKKLSEVLAARLGITAEEAAELAPHTRRLGEPLVVQPTDSVFAPQAPGSSHYGFYVFWRGNDTTPRRLDKVELILVPRWLKLAKPKVDPARIQEAVGKQLSTVTWADWLAERLRVVDPDDAAEIIAHGIYPVDRQPQRLAADDPVSEGQLLVVEHRRIDVMGQWEYDARGTPVSPPWFQFVYAENTGAAFGFMKGLAPEIRSVVFLLLTLLAFGVILTITAKIPPGAWSVYVGLAAILGGAAGNFTDRMRYGYVIDFIDMDLGFMHWPTYNVADIAIAVGVILLIGDMLFNKNSPLVKEPKEPKSDDADAKAATAQA